ncbi:hypothetical protein DYE50_05510 [Treponema ruminis]|nr:hypothetical protein DYE50_05510 [Treponema ruminis]
MCIIAKAIFSFTTANFSLEKDCPFSCQLIGGPTDVAEYYRDIKIPAHSYPVADKWSIYEKWIFVSWCTLA